MKQPKLLTELLELIVKSEKGKEMLLRAKIILADIKDGKNVCKLNKTLYGLRQSGRQWYVKLTTVLKSIDFKPWFETYGQKFDQKL